MKAQSWEATGITEGAEGDLTSNQFAFGNDTNALRVSGVIDGEALGTTDAPNSLAELQPLDPTQMPTEVVEADNDEFERCLDRLEFGKENAPVRVTLSTKYGERVYRLPSVRATTGRSEIEVTPAHFGFGWSNREDADRGALNAIHIWGNPPQDGAQNMSARIRWGFEALSEHDCFAFPRRFDDETQTVSVSDFTPPDDSPGQIDGVVEIEVAEAIDGVFAMKFSAEKLVDKDAYRAIERPNMSGSMPITVVETFDGPNVRVSTWTMDASHYDGDVPEDIDAVEQAQDLTVEKLQKHGELVPRTASMTPVEPPSPAIAVSTCARRCSGIACARLLALTALARLNRPGRGQRDEAKAASRVDAVASSRRSQRRDRRAETPRWGHTYGPRH